MNRALSAALVLPFLPEEERDVGEIRRLASIATVNETRRLTDPYVLVNGALYSVAPDRIPMGSLSPSGIAAQEGEFFVSSIRDDSDGYNPDTLSGPEAAAEYSADDSSHGLVASYDSAHDAQAEYNAWVEGLAEVKGNRAAGAAKARAIRARKAKAARIAKRKAARS